MELTILLCGFASVLGEIVIKLPLRDLRDVLLPLKTLRGEKLSRDVLAESFGDHIVLLQLIARFSQIVRQVVNAETTLLPMRHLPDVGVHGLARIGLGRDAIESAASCTASARYGFAAGSGIRSSILVPEPRRSGILIIGDRLRIDHATLTGASKPGTSLL